MTHDRTVGFPSLSIRHPVLSQLFAAVEKDCAIVRWFSLCMPCTCSISVTVTDNAADRNGNLSRYIYFRAFLTSVAVSPTWRTDARKILRRREWPRYCSNILLSYNKRKRPRFSVYTMIGGDDSRRREKAHEHNCAFRLRKWLGLGGNGLQARIMLNKLEKQLWSRNTRDAQPRRC